MLYNMKLKVCIQEMNLEIKKLMLARKFANYRLHMAGITYHTNDINNDIFSQKFDLPSSFN